MEKKANKRNERVITCNPSVIPRMKFRMILTDNVLRMISLTHNDLSD